MNISIEKNLSVDPSAEVNPYIARIEMPASIQQGIVYQVPVFVRYQGLKKTFFVEICGFQAKAAKPHQLSGLIHELVTRLTNASRLPTYVFIARRARVIYPVYTIDDEVVALTAVGPVFRHVELAKVREYLTDFLHEANVLGEKGLSDKLHVRGISQRTLGLRRPVMYLKKRIPKEVDFWAPVFQTADGRSIYAYAASQRHEVMRDEEEVLDIHEKVGVALQKDRRLNNLFDLRPDRLMPGYWHRLESTLTMQKTIPVGKQAIPVYQHSHMWIGVEFREDEERYGLYLGRDEAEVQHHATLDFTRRSMF